MTASTRRTNRLLEVISLSTGDGMY